MSFNYLEEEIHNKLISLFDEILSTDNKIKNKFGKDVSGIDHICIIYEEITKEKYDEIKSKLKPFNLDYNDNKEYEYENGCSNDSCSL